MIIIGADYHLALPVFFELHSNPRANIEKVTRFGEKRNDIVRPTAVCTTGHIGLKDDFWLSASVKILAGQVLVEDHTESSRSKHHFASRVVDRRGASIIQRIGHRSQRNLITIPEFLFVRTIIFVARAARYVSLPQPGMQCRAEGKKEQNRHVSHSWILSRSGPIPLRVDVSLVILTIVGS
jgi:hypothetical protein